MTSTRGSELRNQFFVIRHGQSEANELGLIASSPDVGLTRFGLTDRGRNQIAETLDANRERLAGVVKVFASDFRRTRETAEIAASFLNTELELSPSLRERHFGQWDGESDKHYQSVWAEDARDPHHECWRVESVANVAKRMWDAVSRIDRSSSDRSFLIVSHGDPLQILITSINREDLRKHRELDPLKTAELRSLGRM